MTKHAAAYLRRSTDRQEQSIGDQRTAIERYATEHGFTIVREYVDDAISGADTKARKAFLQMIKEGTHRSAPFQYVLVYDVSRFGRTGADEAGFFRHTLTQAGIEVVYVAETLTGTDADDLLLATKQWLAHRMVVDLSRVTLRGQLSRVGKGRWCGGRPPYGYDLVYYDAADIPYQTIRFLDSGEREVRLTDGRVQRLIPRGSPLPVTSCDRANLTPGDEAKAATVRRIFDLYVSGGIGIAAIAERLNDDRVVSAMGHRPGTRWKGTWSAGTIREILRNPAYRGATAWNRISYAKFHVVKGGQAVPRSRVALGRVRRNPQADWIIVEGTHEPLVPVGVFERAQRAHQDPGRRHRKGARPIRQGGLALRTLRSRPLRAVRDEVAGLPGDQGPETARQAAPRHPLLLLRRVRREGERGVPARARREGGARRSRHRCSAKAPRHGRLNERRRNPGRREERRHRRRSGPLDRRLGATRERHARRADRSRSRAAHPPRHRRTDRVRSRNLGLPHHVPRHPRSRKRPNARRLK